LLWLAICEVALSGADIVNPLQRTYAAEKRWNDFTQLPNEPLPTFIRKFDLEYRTRQLSGSTPLSEEYKAMQFIMKLNWHFDSLRQELEYARSVGRDEYPKTIAKAYEIALARQDTFKLSHTNARTSHRSAFLNEAQAKKPSGKDKKSPSECTWCGKKGHREEQCYSKQNGKPKTKRESTTPSSKDEKAENATVAFTKQDSNTLQDSDSDDDNMRFKGVRASIYTTTVLSDTANVLKASFNKYTMLLDSGSAIHIFKDAELLSNIHRAQYPLRVSGMYAANKVELVGSYGPLPEVWYDPTVPANIVSLALISKTPGWDVTFNQTTNEYLVENAASDITWTFKEHELHYLRDASLDEQFVNANAVVDDSDDAYVLLETVHGNEMLLTNRELKGAKLASEWYAKLGFPSTADLKAAINLGSIKNIDITAADVDNAERVYGRQLGNILGKLTNVKTKPLLLDSHLRKVIEPVILSGDIMFIEGLAFLITVSKRLTLVSAAELKDRSADTMRAAIYDIFSHYSSNQFKVQTVIFDGEGAIGAIATDLKLDGIEVVQTSRGQHVPDVERAIRTLKERIRGFLNTLPFRLDSILLIELVYYCTIQLNLFPGANTMGGRSPRELLTGRVPDAKKLCALSFGQFVYVSKSNAIKNNMEPRAIPAIALSPVGNETGSYYFMSLQSWKTIQSANWVTAPMSDDTIKKLNDRAAAEQHSIRTRSMTRQDDNVTSGDQLGAGWANTESRAADIREEVVPTEAVEHEVQAASYVNISVRKAMQLYPDDATKSIQKELQQMLDKKVFTPIRYADIGSDAQVINSHLFLKRKRDNTLKSRLVADGSSQLRSQDVSSPTVATESVFMMCAIIASEHRQVCTMDIEGAYLHADMKTNVVMRMENILAQILSKLDQSFESYRTKSGAIYVRLDKALYGCVESAKLFYEHLSTTLYSLGYKSNTYDSCTFNNFYLNFQVTVLVHVDDLLVSCQNIEALRQLHQDLVKVYNKVTITYGPVVSYLGIDLDFTRSGVVTLSMSSQIQEIIEELGVEGEKLTPASLSLYEKGVQLEALAAKDRQSFHSTVAKLLYIAIRCRPDILVAVSWLCTRVTDPNLQDSKKLLRVLKYLNGTRDLKLKLSTNNGLKIYGFIDASFAVHPDYKGQTGLAVTFGTGVVLAKSVKQRVVAKSSTEAELVAISDALSHIIWIRNFLIDQGYDVDPAVIFQDNKSTIKLTEKGGPCSSRTRHVAIRYFFVKDFVDRKEVVIEFMPTEDMVADILTKPLTGELFLKLRDKLLGHTNTS
jgi:hypothetical protein